VAVKKERRLELALEGERYFDLVRWLGDADGIDANILVGSSGIAWKDNGLPGKSTNGLFPIPSLEIDRTGGTMPQNPGY
jgi:hypothetical protein